jgi:hypothetical protein
VSAPRVRFSRLGSRPGLPAGWPRPFDRVTTSEITVPWTLDLSVRVVTQRS